MFLAPVESEDWKEREPMQLYKFMEESAEDEESELPKVERPPEPVPDHLKESILAAILAAFGTAPCLAAVKDRDRLVRLFPEFAGTLGSAMRLLALFTCIHDDDSPRGIRIKANFQRAKSAGSFMRPCLKTWPHWYKDEIDSLLASLPEEEEN
jgi:hypothetical protein